MDLVIVESPTKAKTISRFLGHSYMVRSSFGHVRDLPKNYLGIDIKNNFQPKYSIISKAKKVVSELKKFAESEKIIMATDEDREGEAIAWHLIQALGLNKGKSKKEKGKTEEKGKGKMENGKTDGKLLRIVFHEITKKAIEEALKNPRGIDMNLVNAQQARRVLDRLVGYKLSPFLWKKVARGLSAGRVQSVALRLIADREKEIEKFKPEEYWTIEAKLKSKNSEKEFIANLIKINDKSIPKPGIKTKKEADKILKDLKDSDFIVKKVEKKEIKRIPPPPFVTSTLQQEAFRRLRFSSKQTMMIAQQLYEGIELGKGKATGLITYMRTDSTNIADQALWAAKETIIKLFGKEYYNGYPRRYKTKSRLAQEAHEAVRPVNPSITPDSIKEYLDTNQFKLYDLIWRRFIATQMKEALFNTVDIEILASKKYIFYAHGQVLRFEGFLKIYPISYEESLLPEVKKEEKLEILDLISNQHFTKPPPRYNEASLVKTLEKYGIGRPSTYAPIISTIQERNYVYKDKARYFHPTEIGVMVNNLLVKHFPNIVDLKFTSHMEEDLDEIAQGKEDWVRVVREFYGPFHKNLLKKYEEVGSVKIAEETDEICDKCGAKMVIRMGKFGKFLACSKFPECKNTKNLPK